MLSLYLKRAYYKFAGVPMLGQLLKYAAPKIKNMVNGFGGERGAKIEDLTRQLAAIRLNLNLQLAASQEYARNCPDISLVICTCDRAGNLENALHSADRLAYPALEIICVCGPCRDGTERVLEKWRHKIRICHCPERNIAMSRNVGIGAAQGEIVAFLDDDALPKPDWLVEMAARFADGTLAAVGGFTHGADGVAWQARAGVGDLFGDVAQYASEEAALKACGRQEAGNGQKYFSPLGANMAFKREALLEIGGFDENFAWHLDETDVFLRLAQAGKKTGYAEAAQVIHKMAENLSRKEDLTPKSLYHQARSKTYFVMAHAAPVYGRKLAEKRLNAWLGWLESATARSVRLGRLSGEDGKRLMRELDQGQLDGMDLLGKAHAGSQKKVCAENL